MPLNNPEGHNQYGEKDYPPDDELSAALHLYAREKLTTNLRLVRLKKDFGLVIGKWKLNELNNKFKVPSSRKPPPQEELDAIVLEVVNLDRTGLRGVKSISAYLQSEGIVIARDRIRDVLVTHDVQGLLKRYPGGKPLKPNRVALLSAGPNEMHHADGWEKLGVQALNMGVGIPAYGYTDQCSSKRLYLVAVPNSRLQDVIVHVHLDFIERMGCIAITHVVDKGSELGLAMQVQREIRALVAPDLDEETYPPFVQLKSVHNTPAEGSWHWLRNFDGYNMYSDITDGAAHFSANDPIQFCLFYWIWPPLIQAALDKYVDAWNVKKIRKQPNKMNPSGYTPNHVFAVPESLGLVDLRIPVSKELVDYFRGRCTLTRKQALSFCSDSFSTAAETVHRGLGSPTITRQSAWSIFRRMLLPLREVYDGVEPEKAYIFNRV